MFMTTRDFPRKSTFFPHRPVLTEQTLPNQWGKVFTFTGVLGGIGKDLTSILYKHDAKQAHPLSSGELVFLSLKLDDLVTIKASARTLLSRESRLDVLWNNAGVMVPPQGSKSTAKIAPRTSVRVVWASSSAIDHAPKPAINFSNMHYHREEGICPGSEAVISTQNLGNFYTGLQKTMPKWQVALFKLVSQHPKNDAYTGLFAGLDQSITQEDNGGWVSPYGKLEQVRKDLVESKLCKDLWQ
ncbi:hypothetical protein BDW59DRAFT_168928 [Aspergillus cavernicola]|uniref:Uncharacterized protein n=1 Tax=Aspergillus cavernicola TaxID=176166 RepID=A0ABR4J1W9_9EURO